MEKSHYIEVQRKSHGPWEQSPVRFRTKEEANTYGRDLWAQFNNIREWRLAESDALPTHRIINGKLVSDL